MVDNSNYEGWGYVGAGFPLVKASEDGERLYLWHGWAGKGGFPPTPPPDTTGEGREDDHHDDGGVSGE